MQTDPVIRLNAHAAKDETVLADLAGAELSRIVEAFVGTIAGRGAGTLQPKRDSPIDAEWQAWFENIFAPTICPAFTLAYEAASRSRYHAIPTINGELEKSLPADQAQRAGTSGHIAWREIALPQRRKWEAEMAKMEAPPLLPIVFAIHTALFHLPIVQSLQGYAWLETNLASDRFAPSDLRSAWRHVISSCAVGISHHANFGIS